MKPCQKEHFLRKKAYYEKQAKAERDKANTDPERIKYFEGMVKQIEFTLNVDNE